MSEPSDHRPKILVVDDSKVMRLSARKILAEEFDLLLAEDGDDAWAQLQSDPQILALFSDLGMPGLDGYALLEQIRAHDEARINAMPVIIVTGDDEDKAREDALSRGATDFITKPFDRAQLLARARSYASHDQMRRRMAELEAANTRDTITDLGNKRYFELRLKEIRANSLRHERPMVLLRIDVTEFDRVLQSRGKRVAVRLLQEIGQQLQAGLREEDVIARLSAGRFVVIGPDCDREGAEALCERINGQFEGHLFAEEHRITLRPVIGAYLPPLSRDEKLSQIYALAQQAVAQAAEKGPGSVVCLPRATVNRQPPEEDELVERLEKLLAAYPPEVVRGALERVTGLAQGDR